ncbi:MAG: hypothetical protein L3K06_04400, partial [Thermoplasmata archaeon]|nr:hypothetical protein [Thermoplasmata archaeon]
VPRARGPFRARFRLGLRTVKEHRVLRQGTRDVGYAYLTKTRESVGVHELMVTRPEHEEALIRALEWEARGRWLWLGTSTFILDAASPLAARGFVRFDASHRVLMARALAGRTSRDRQRAFFAAFRDPRFSCHRGDMF